MPLAVSSIATYEPTAKEKEKGVILTGSMLFPDDVYVAKVQLCNAVNHETGETFKTVRFPGYYNEEKKQFFPYVDGVSRSFREACVAALEETEKTKKPATKEIDGNYCRSVRVTPYSKGPVVGLATYAVKDTEGHQAYSLKSIRLKSYDGKQFKVEAPGSDNNFFHFGAKNTKEFIVNEFKKQTQSQDAVRTAGQRKTGQEQ